MASEKDVKIGDWNKKDLKNYIRKQISYTPVTLPTSIAGEEMRATNSFVLEGQLELSPQAISYLKSVLGL